MAWLDASLQLVILLGVTSTLESSGDQFMHAWWPKHWSVEKPNLRKLLDLQPSCNLGGILWVQEFEKWRNKVSKQVWIAATRSYRSLQIVVWASHMARIGTGTKLVRSPFPRRNTCFQQSRIIGCPKRTKMIRSRGSARAFSGVGSMGRQCKDWPAASFISPHASSGRASAALLILENARWQALIRHLSFVIRQNMKSMPIFSPTVDGSHYIWLRFLTTLPPWHCFSYMVVMYSVFSIGHGPPLSYLHGNKLRK